jgi:hypothetical protein
MTLSTPLPGSDFEPILLRLADNHMLANTEAVDDAADVLAEVSAENLRIAIARRDCLESALKPFSRIDLVAAIVVGIQDIRAGCVDQLLGRNKLGGADNVTPSPVQC